MYHTTYINIVKHRHNKTLSNTSKNENQGKETLHFAMNPIGKEIIYNRKVVGSFS
jgi:hypothetical protein